jgi:hypothetical protein
LLLFFIIIIFSIIAIIRYKIFNGDT